MLLDGREAFYGGAAGGGKSDALLMGALQYVDQPGYAALILRRTYSQLTLPDSIMDRAHQWLDGTDAVWSGDEHQFRFPSNATLTFGHMQYETDKYRYQGPAFQYVGFDELTQFLETQYRYMFSRLRRLEGSMVPLRVRGASNPGGIGHEWVKRRLIDEGAEHGRVFVPAKLSDNPSLDREEYIKSLQELDPVTLQQLLNGDWTVRPAGGMFRREWFEIVDAIPTPARQFEVRFWDLAGTAPAKGRDPDWTVGVRMSRAAGLTYVSDVVRVRGNAATVDALIKQTAALDGIAVKIRMEQEPGSSGKRAIEGFQRGILAGYDFAGVPSTGSKQVRAGPFASQAAAGNVKLLRGRWNGDWLDELEAFPEGSHDDQVDASSGAYLVLTPNRTWKVA